MTVNERTRPAGGSAERAETRKGSRAGVVSQLHFITQQPRRQVAEIDAMDKAWR